MIGLVILVFRFPGMVRMKFLRISRWTCYPLEWFEGVLVFQLVLSLSILTTFSSWRPASKSSIGWQRYWKEPIRWQNQSSMYLGSTWNSHSCGGYPSWCNWYLHCKTWVGYVNDVIIIIHLELLFEGQSQWFCPFDRQLWCNHQFDFGRKAVKKSYDSFSNKSLEMMARAAATMLRDVKTSLGFEAKMNNIPGWWLSQKWWKKVGQTYYKVVAQFAGTMLWSIFYTKGQYSL